MSKRFGRNQRRRAREEIATLTTLLTKERHIAQRYHRELEEVRQIVGRNSTVLQARTVALGGEPQAATIGYSVYGEFGVRRVSAPVMVARMKREDSAFGAEIHFRVNYNGKACGYVVAEEALLAWPREVMIERVAREIAEQLA